MHHMGVSNKFVGMPVDRISVMMDPDLGQAVREAAATAGISVSRWVADAAAERLRHQLLGAALAAWDVEDGALSAEELDAASRELNLPGRHGRARVA